MQDVFMKTIQFVLFMLPSDDLRVLLNAMADLDAVSIKKVVAEGLIFILCI